MPTKVGKPNTNSQLKSSMPSGAIPRSGGGRPSSVGQVSTNAKIWNVSGGGKAHNSGGGMKRGRKMY